MGVAGTMIPCSGAAIGSMSIAGTRGSINSSRCGGNIDGTRPGGYNHATITGSHPGSGRK
jgi:hypothetical protein